METCRHATHPRLKKHAPLFSLQWRSCSGAVTVRSSRSSGTPVATRDPIPDEVYRVVGQVVVRGAALEGLLLELCTAVKINRNVGSPVALEARRKWARTPGTVLIDLMLNSL